MSLADIGIGWGRWLGLLSIPEAVRAESNRRLEICDTCEHAIPSKVLEIINDSVEEVHHKYCNECKCPCHQKSLTDDVCRLGKWALPIK